MSDQFNNTPHLGNNSFCSLAKEFVSLRELSIKLGSRKSDTIVEKLGFINLKIKDALLSQFKGYFGQTIALKTTNLGIIEGVLEGIKDYGSAGPCLHIKVDRKNNPNSLISLKYDIIGIEELQHSYEISQSALDTLSSGTKNKVSEIL